MSAQTVISKPVTGPGPSRPEAVPSCAACGPGSGVQGHCALLADVLRELKEIKASLGIRDRKSLSVAEAARYANVGSVTVRRWLERGALKGAKAGRRKQSHWRIHKRDLDAYLDRNVNQATFPRGREQEGPTRT